MDTRSRLSPDARERLSRARSPNPGTPTLVLARWLSTRPAVSRALAAAVVAALVVFFVWLFH